MLKNKKTPFHIQLSYLFATLIIVFGLALDTLLFEKMRQILLVEVDSQYELIGQKVVNSVLNVYERAKVQAQLLARHDLSHAENLQQRLIFVPYLTTAIDSSDATIAAYVAYPNGDYFAVREWTETDIMRKRFNAPPKTAWLVENIAKQDQTWTATILYLDESRNELARVTRTDIAFDARTRAWYQLALQRKADEVVGTDPYYFHADGMLGFSYATKVTDQPNSAIVGVDIEISELASVLEHGKGSPSSRIALLTHNGDVLALQAGNGDPYMPAPVIDSEGKYSLPNLKSQNAPILFKLFQADQLTIQGSHLVRHMGEDWESFNAEIQIPNGNPLHLLITSPHSELLANITRLRQQTLLLSALVVLLGIGLTVYFSRFASKPLKRLADAAASIAHFDFSQPINVQSNITEIDDLATAMVHMKSTIRSFLELSVSLSSETDIDDLLARVLDELSSVIGSEKGVLYLYQPQQKMLQAAYYKSSQASQLSASDFKEIDINDLSHPIALACGSQCHIATMQPEQCAMWFGHHEELKNERNLIAIPLIDRNANLVGAIGLMMKEGDIDLGRQKMAEAISGSAAVAIENQLLIHEQKALLEAFIQLIAGAIDAKSPYTGGHCQRVPVLTKMLAAAACQEKTGEFADFDLSGNEWEQLHIAAWLHDCGKVTTPEYVVDKATKLESLTDRIHEIRMRFEVLKRDAEIIRLTAVSRGSNQLEQQLIFDEKIAQLNDDFAFVASCNEGGEYLDPAKIERLKRIAQQTWQKTLSDRIGISHEEKIRKDRTPEAILPATENLLADQPDHLIARSERDQIAPDNPWGFKVDVPDYLYNRGELHNLTISRGTLTAEERFKINEHIIQTIIMLEKLPFPRHLSQVPEIAGGHHEKMDGTGYPKRLFKEQMSLPARMMAIADIFEALTAADRPYKSGKKLSEALQIMHLMQKDNHIDSALFRLFLRSGVYLDYAKRFMNPDQIDEVDIGLYV
jgi:HD-GYP domain-containing protein (c-di-GMP phosphodiesterase class II)/HAMP domain-containing protein